MSADLSNILDWVESTHTEFASVIPWLHGSVGRFTMVILLTGVLIAVGAWSLWRYDKQRKQKREQAALREFKRWKIFGNDFIALLSEHEMSISEFREIFVNGILPIEDVLEELRKKRKKGSGRRSVPQRSEKAHAGD